MIYLEILMTESEMTMIDGKRGVNIFFELRSLLYSIKMNTDKRKI